MKGLAPVPCLRDNPPEDGGRIQSAKTAMITAIFEFVLDRNRKTGFSPHYERQHQRLLAAEGLISVERYRSESDSNKFLFLSFWRDIEALDRWRGAAASDVLHAPDEDDTTLDFRLRIARILRDETDGEGDLQ